METSKAKACKECEGNGYVEILSFRWESFGHVETTTGKPCPICDGGGFIHDNKN